MDTSLFQSQGFQNQSTCFYFFHRVCRKAHTNRISDSFSQNHGQSHGRFDITGPNCSGFCDAYMQRIGAGFCHNFMGFHRHQNIGRLHGKYQILIAHFLYQTQIRQGRLSKSLCSNSTMIFFQNFLFQGTGIYPDSNGNLSFLGAVHHSPKPFRRADVSRINTDFIRAVFHGKNRHAVVEMDIRNNRNRRSRLYLL